jgi:hypothetical protein
MSGRMILRQSAWRIFRWPIAIAIVSLVGLVSALVGDGWYDVLSWICLGTCIVTMTVAWRRRSAA